MLAEIDWANLSWPATLAISVIAICVAAVLITVITKM